MSSQLIDGLVQELNGKLGDRPFYTLPEIVTIGVFGTVQTAREALKDGRLPYIRVSERRCIVPRQSLIKYLEDNCVHK